MISVVHVAADLGQGGTERSIELLATAAEGPPGQRVIALDRDGPTGERLRAAGIPVEVFAGNYAGAAASIAARGPAVALLNRSGRPEAKWTELIGRLAKGPVLPLEVSHFGWLDRGAIEAGLKGSFAVSGTTLAKYLRQMFGHWPRAEEMAGVPLALAAGNNPVAPLAGAARRPHPAPPSPGPAARCLHRHPPGPARSAQMERSTDPPWRAAPGRSAAASSRLPFGAPEPPWRDPPPDGRARHAGPLHDRARDGRPLPRRQRCHAALRALWRILRLCLGRGRSRRAAGDRAIHALGRQCPGRADPRWRDRVPCR